MNADIKKIIKTSGKILLRMAYFLLQIFLVMLGSKSKEREPTTEELTCGERIIGSDQYDFPDQESHK